MKAKELMEINKGDGLWTQIATDYGKDKGAYAGAIAVTQEMIKQSIADGFDASELREHYDHLSTANAICELAGIDPHYLEKEIDTVGYFDSFLRTLEG